LVAEPAADDYKAIAQRLRELQRDGDAVLPQPVLNWHCEWCNRPMAMSPSGLRCLQCDRAAMAADAS
jgi:hypothetical protein